jgi:hypothetical protein
VTHETIRAFLRRSAVDRPIDWVRFRLDTFPRALPRIRQVDYQELPEIGLHAKHAYRTQAVRTRWAAMSPLIAESRCTTAVDIGSNSGWFVFTLAGRGITTVGIEGDERLIRISHYARGRLRARSSGFLLMTVDPVTVRLVPRADCTIVLSVWHHLVRDYGLETATTILANLWENTSKVLFFETGESAELSPSWGLPEMEPDSRGWLEHYLSDVCAGGGIRHLGLHETISPEGIVSRRNLFGVVRTDG